MNFKIFAVIVRVSAVTTSGVFSVVTFILLGRVTDGFGGGASIGGGMYVGFAGSSVLFSAVLLVTRVGNSMTLRL